MTNFERITNCSNPEDLVMIHMNLSHNAIYADGRLLDSSNPDDILLWFNKESDELDSRTIFDIELHPCSKCGVLPTIKMNLDRTMYYECDICHKMMYKFNTSPRTEIAARSIWNEVN